MRFCPFGFYIFIWRLRLMFYVLMQYIYIISFDSYYDNISLILYGYNQSSLTAFAYLLGNLKRRNLGRNKFVLWYLHLKCNSLSVYLCIFFHSFPINAYFGFLQFCNNYLHGKSIWSLKFIWITQIMWNAFFFY